MHTPGPLTVRQAKGPVDGEFDCAIVAVIDGQPQVIGEAFGRSSETARPPARANATLWAAAPELLEALEGLLIVAEEELTDSYCASCDQHAPKDRDGNLIGVVPHGPACSIPNARAAIAKARGGA